MSRIVFVTGDKGGVGKSFTSRVLLDWYEAKGIPVKAYDTDKTNSTLFRFFNENESKNMILSQLDTDNQGDLDSFLNVVAENKDSVFVIDCAARTMDRLLTWMKEIGFFELAQEHEIKVTLAFVLGPEKDCVAILKDIASEFEDNADYILIKNEGKGSEFKVYDGSKTRERILKTLSGIEINIPLLHSKTSLEVDRLSIPFSVAKDSTVLGLAERSRVRTFQSRVFQQLDQAEALWMK